MPQFPPKAFAPVLALAGCAVLQGLPTGAPSGRAGVPGETTCLSCHSGIRQNTGGGNVSITLPGSFFYRPGVTQRVRVTVNDTAGLQFGFQLSARLASDAKKPGGSLSVPAGLVPTGGPGGPGPGGPGPGGPGPGGFGGGAFGTPIRVVCWSGDLDEDDSPKPASGCPASAPIESIVQGRPIFGLATGSASWEFDWIPPDSDQGDITLYVSANAAIDEDHARVYTSSVTLIPAGFPLRPQVDRVLLANGYGNGTTFAPGTWIRVMGGDLAATIRNWGTADFAGNRAPNELDSVRVMAGGKRSFVSSIGPDGVVAILPADISSGNVALTVNVGDVASAPVNIAIAERAPYLAVRNVGGKSYVAAVLANGAPITPPRTGGPGGGPGGPGGNARLAQAGDVLTVTGIGFGAVPGGVAIGQRGTAAGQLPAVAIKVGDKSADVQYAGFQEDTFGYYLIRFVVPAGVPSGDASVTLSIGGTQSSQQLILPMQ